MNTFKIGQVLKNGATVLACKEDDTEELGIVLAMNIGGQAMPYVTWLYFQGELDSTYSGNYHLSIEGAVEDYTTRNC